MVDKEFTEFFEWGFTEPLRNLGIMDDLGLIIIAVCFGVTLYRALKSTKDRKAAKEEAARLEAEGINSENSEKETK